VFVGGRIAAVALFAAGAACTGSAFAQLDTRGAQPPDALVAPFVTTPMGVVDEMLALAGVGPADVVVDLGSGDGRLVIAAVARFGARRGFGVDIDATLVDYANRKAAEAGVAERVRFHVRDLFDTDVREATVVTVYLLPIAMNRLQDKLLAELAPGTRVVSHDYPFRGWTAERVVSLDVPEKNDYTGRRSTSLYLYKVPARAAGSPR
jgi:ubiquinone/menaquinone biosynthesis C-methylase UbiE